MTVFVHLVTDRIAQHAEENRWPNIESCLGSAVTNPQAPPRLIIISRPLDDGHQCGMKTSPLDPLVAQVCLTNWQSCAAESL
jgi:hypothetical protein